MYIYQATNQLKLYIYMCVISLSHSVSHHFSIHKSKENVNPLSPPSKISRLIMLQNIPLGYYQVTYDFFLSTDLRSVLRIFLNFTTPPKRDIEKKTDLGIFLQLSKLFHPPPKARHAVHRVRQGTLRFTNWFCSGRMKATRIPSSVAATGGDRNMKRMRLSVPQVPRLLEILG